MMQQRDRRRKRSGQAARFPSCQGFLGIIDTWSHGEDRVEGHCKKGNHSLDNPVVPLWPQGIVLVLLPRIPRV